MGDLFDEYQSTTASMLSKPAGLLPAQTSLRCVAWEFPSFAPRRSWSIVSAFGAWNEYSVVELSCDLDAAHATLIARAAVVSETADALKIARRSAPLDATATRRILDEVGGVNVKFVSPAFEPTSLGRDGTTFGLTLYGVQNDSRLTWWGDGPAEWRDAVAWAARLRVHLQQAIEHDGARLPPFDPTWALVVDANDANLTTATKVLREELQLAIADVPKLKQALRSGAPVMRSTRSSVERVAAAVREAGVAARVVASAETASRGEQERR